jgi:hypothetical protein
MRWAGHVAFMGPREMLIGFWWDSQKEKDLDVGGRIILKSILDKVGWGGMDWIDLGQDKDHWRALVNTVMNLRVP